MNRQETEKIILMMQAAYPNYHPNKVYTINAWSVMLDEYDYKTVETALKSFIMNEKDGFAPSIGQIVDIIHHLKQPERLNRMQAWSLVRKAIQNSIYHSVEEYEKLPILIQNAVGSPGQLRSWAMAEDFNENVISSNFGKVYDKEVALAERNEKSVIGYRNAIDDVNGSSDRILIDNQNKTSIEMNNYVVSEELDLNSVNGVPMPEKYRKEFNIAD